MTADFQGEICRNNIIRGNTFRDQRVFTEFDNGSMVWGSGLGLRDNLITGNELRGSEGLGIVVYGGRRNRITGNAFSNLPGVKDIENPFPGTAVVLDERTRANRVLGNKFRNVVRRTKDLGTGNIIGADQQQAREEGRADLQPSRAGDSEKLRLLRKWIRP